MPCGLVELEVQSPHVVAVLGSEPGSGAITEAASLVPTLWWPLQPLVPPQRPGPLGVDDQAFTATDVMGFAPTPAGMTASELTKPFPQHQLPVIGWLLWSPLGRAVLTGQAAGPTL
jgi:hypothetical protein